MVPVVRDVPGLRPEVTEPAAAEEQEAPLIVLALDVPTAASAPAFLHSIDLGPGTEPLRRKEEAIRLSPLGSFHTTKCSPVLLPLEPGDHSLAQ